MKVTLILLALQVFGVAENKFALNCILQFKADAVIPIYFDNDNCQELAVKNDTRFYLTNQKNISLFQINFTEEDCQFLGCLDIDNKPPKELLFRQKKDNRAWVHIYSENRPINKFIAVNNTKKTGIWDGDICDAKLLDINNDYNKDLILNINTAFEMQPRGILAYDLKNNKELWHFWTGPSPKHLFVVDVDNDGNEEIVISTTAVSNGSIINGFSDQKSYVIVFNKYGNVLWHREIGGSFSDVLCWVGDLENKNEMNVVAIECE